MDAMDSTRWQKVNDFFLTCGSVHEPYRFCVAVLENIADLISYDQGLFLMLDGNRKVSRSYFSGIPQRWSSMYLDYYSKSTFTDFTLDRDVEVQQGEGYVSLIDWEDLDWIKDDFMVSYIRPRGLSQSLALALFDLKGSPMTAFSLDRLHSKQFSDEEVEIAKLLSTHLGNLYKNMFVRPQGQVRIWDHRTVEDELTPRETEVLDLLCQGVKPSYIARDLKISIGTANKHIAHIYKKLGVGSRQELLVKLLGK